MDLTTIGVALGIIVALISIAGSLWRLGSKAMQGLQKVGALKAQVSSLKASFRVLSEQVEDIAGYLSSDENQNQRKFHLKSGFKRMESAFEEDFDNENTIF